MSKVTARESVDRDLRTLAGHMRPVFAALKRGGPMPKSFQEEFERSALGMRHVPELSLSATSLMVGELSRAGLLERAEDEHDRRRTIVRIPDEYRDSVDAWLQVRLDPLRRTLERLSPRARENFLEGWRILEEETSQIPDELDCGE
jgi:hypothetical protein